MKDFPLMAMCLKSETLNNARKNEGGNVLFLILITVVLFAALSYAVTQSSQTAGGGGTGDETGEVSAAQMNQFPNFVRAQTMRMMMRRIDVTDLEFNPPSAFGTLSSDEVGVFHPSSGTTYVTASPSLMANEAQGEWYFNMNFEIDAIGTSLAGNFGGNDLIAFLPGIKANVCQRINDLLAISTIPTVNDISYLNEASENMEAGYSFPSSETVIGGANLTQFYAEPFGCFQETVSGTYIYYFSIYER